MHERKNFRNSYENSFRFMSPNVSKYHAMENLFVKHCLTVILRTKKENTLYMNRQDQMQTLLKYKQHMILQNTLNVSFTSVRVEE